MIQLHSMNNYIFSTPIIKLVNIDESSHEEVIVIFITNKDLNMTEQIMLQSMNMVTALNYPIKKKYIY